MLAKSYNKNKKFFVFILKREKRYAILLPSRNKTEEAGEKTDDKHSDRGR
jgi:hypothetical protein